MKRYTLERSEQVRQEHGYTTEQFSVVIGFSPTAYRLAVRRGYLTRAMALEFCSRFNVAIDELKELNGSRRDVEPWKGPKRKRGVTHA